MVFSLPNIINLGGVDLTDEGRAPLQTTLELREVMVELANGSKKKYIKGKHWRKWVVTWDNTAKSVSQTVDGFGGRDEIKLIAFTPGALTLLVQEATPGEETYIVFVESYDEEVLRRRTDDIGMRYKVTLSLIEAQ